MRHRGFEGISIVGLGYVGLATAVCFAGRGFRVIGLEIDKSKLETLRKGISPIHEEGLQPLLRSSIRKGSLLMSSNFQNIAQSKIIFITVGTPSKEDGGINTEYLEAAAREIGRQLSSIRGYRLVVVKSTVTPGTTEGVVLPILEKESGKKAGKGFGLASNPEFLHEGSAIRETLQPEALVIGGFDNKSSSTLQKLYRAFYKKSQPTILTTISNAEMMKYAINAGRATQLSFVNTIANLCSRISGCDYDEVRKGLAMVARMDQRYLAAGMGFGGSCLGKDSRALASALRSAGVSDDILSSAQRVNDGQVSEAIRLAEKTSGPLDGKHVAVLGLSFKANTDDIRESVAISLIRVLIRKSAEINVYDPVAMDNTRKLLGNQITYAKSAKAALKGTECAFVATGWDSFKKLKPRDFKTMMATPLVVDGRRILDQARLLRGGVRIETIGTGPALERAKKGKAGEGKEWRYTFGGHVVHPSDV